MSCGFLDQDPRVIASETFYTSESEVLYGLAGVYGVMNNQAMYGDKYSLSLSNVDDLCYFNRATTTSYTQIYRHDPSSSEIYDVWSELYEGIKNANAFLEAVPETGFDVDGKYCNEARFMRAYYHFLLAQAWGHVPLRKSATKQYNMVMLPATPQYEVLKWCIEEMEDCLFLADEGFENSPSRVNKNTMKGIIARVCLFTAGATVDRNGDSEKLYYKKAMDYTYEVINSHSHQLNPSYKDVFVNMIADQYDKEYRESMWEVEFRGDRSSADMWSNGTIGQQIGLQSTGASNYEKFKCNFSYALYNGSLQLWDLYWTKDRTFEEDKLPIVTDTRHEWNMCPYNYSGYSGSLPLTPYDAVEGDGRVECVRSIDKTPYIYNKENTKDNPIVAVGNRNASKWRREIEYEGLKADAGKNQFTSINFPLLRYSDVLLMYAEAYNEYNSAPSAEAFDCVKAVRDRAGIATKDYETNYSDYLSFQQFVRNERGRELCFEALRKYDLIRWGIFVTEMGKYPAAAGDPRWIMVSSSEYAAAIGAAVMEKHIVLPIPTMELSVNDLLSQHPLW